MSTRHARVADKELNDKHTKILIELLQKPKNKICADYRKKDPRWASWNLGIFVCIRCSGTHRSLGTHISKVKSVDLDTWTPEQIENMVKLGNERSNSYWEANLGDKEPSDYNMDVWIRAKYEQKRWIEKSGVDNSVDEVKDKKPETASVEQHTKKESVTKIEPVTTKEPVITNSVPESDFISQIKYAATTNKKISSPPKATTSGYNLDMSSFQQQLSGLSMGRPSTGLIPQAPPGSNTSWTNFLINQKNGSSSSDCKSTILNKPPTEKPLIPYDAFASLRRS